MTSIPVAAAAGAGATADTEILPTTETLTVEQIRARRTKNVQAMLTRVRKEIPEARIRIAFEHSTTPNHLDWIVFTVDMLSDNIVKIIKIGFETEFLKYGIEKTGSDYGPGPYGIYKCVLFFGKNDKIWKDFEKERDIFFKKHP
jgi:hypothetical protein